MKLEAIHFVAAGILAASALAYAGAFVTLAKRRRLLEYGALLPGLWQARHAFSVFVVFLGAQVVAYAVNMSVFDSRDNGALLSLMALLYTANIATLYVVYRITSMGGAAARALGLGGSKVRAALRGYWMYLLFIPLQMCYVVVVSHAWRAAMGQDMPQQAVARAMRERGLVDFAALAFFALIVAPVVEEVIFRGFIQKGLERSYGGATAVAITSVLFALAHGVRAALLVLPIGVALGLLYQRTKSLPLCIGFHFGVNFTSVIGALVLRMTSP